MTIVIIWESSSLVSVNLKGCSCSSHSCVKSDVTTVLFAFFYLYPEHTQHYPFFLPFFCFIFHAPSSHSELSEFVCDGSCSAALTLHPSSHLNPEFNPLKLALILNTWHFKSLQFQIQYYKYWYFFLKQAGVCEDETIRDANCVRQGFKQQVCRLNSRPTLEPVRSQAGLRMMNERANSCCSTHYRAPTHCCIRSARSYPPHRDGGKDAALNECRCRYCLKHLSSFNRLQRWQTTGRGIFPTFFPWWQQLKSCSP